MSKRTLGLIFFLLIITVVLFLFAALPKTTNKLIETKKVPTPTIVKETNLFISPSTLSLSSSSGSLNVDVSTEKNNVTGIQLEMAFDSKVISITSITPGGFFQNPTELIKEIDSKNGRISYVLTLPARVPAKKGTGTVAVINFKVLDKKAGETSISFLPITKISAEGVDPSVLKTSTGATITINSPKTLK